MAAIPPKPGASAFLEDSQKNERKTDRQGRNTSPANEGLADASPVPVAGEGLSRVEMSQELPVLGTGAPFARPKGRVARVRRLFMRTQVDNDDEPQVLAVVPLPSDAEHRREIMLIDIILAGDPLGWDTPVVTQ
jgi:hypothetical protein